MGKRVTIPQAAEITGLSDYALRTGIRSGRYPHIRVGLGAGKILIDIDLLEQYLRQEAVDNTHRGNPSVVHYGQLRKVSV